MASIIKQIFLSQFPSAEKNSTVCLKWQNSAMIKKNSCEIPCLHMGPKPQLSSFALQCLFAVLGTTIHLYFYKFGA